ncbi:hypothetical protein SEA_VALENTINIPUFF_53 [Microbacterium phage ValentiniPuff]|uniref:Uncharacterized protein n=1 Tax=Microbacterium phage ValentiniPuff TaxID=2315705 RepID=A0A386KS90_9CAUD|nr:hypothetical protein SEA_VALENTINIPUFF_53 [Microbacterium phage ValentiniPuff]
MKTTRIGDVGDRVVISGVVMSAELQAPTEFGFPMLVKIRGAQGELAYWISTSDAASKLKAGEPITLRATVKKYKLIAEDLWVNVTNGTVVADALAIV